MEEYREGGVRNLSRGTSLARFPHFRVGGARGDGLVGGPDLEQGEGRLSKATGGWLAIPLTKSKS